MKKLTLILLVFFCTGLQAQERVTLRNNVYVNFNIWDIPNGADTTLNKEVAYYFDIDESVVENYYKNNPDKLVLKYVLSDNQLSYFDRKRNHRWAMYRNGASQVQQPRIVHTIVEKQPTPSELKRDDVKAALRALIIQGNSYDDAWRKIDSAFYGIYTIINDSIN